MDKRKKPISKFKKNGIKLILAFLLILLFLFLTFVVPIIINESYKTNTGYLTLWDASDVLSFYAVILSGLITIAALIATIYYSNREVEKQIKFSQSQTNVPFFIIEKVYQLNNQGDFVITQDGLTWKNEFKLNKYGNTHEEILITLRNIGEGIAIAPHYLIDSNTIRNNNIPQFVTKGNTLELTYNLKRILEDRFSSGITLDNFQSFNTCLTLYYQNTLGLTFNQIITFKHDQSMESNSVILHVSSISSQSVDV